eukprot:5669194-Pleurochrysis_carterae.AAC.1
MALNVPSYLPNFLCPRRVYVWTAPRLVKRLSRDSATGRSWTDGRPNCLRGKTLVTSLIVTFT